MKKLFSSKPIGAHWGDYWRECRRDTDFISNSNIYPLHPINSYLNKQQRILECGCGLGRVLKHYFHQGYKIEGIELDEYAVRTLQRENPNIPLKVGDILSLPYDDHSFDVVTVFGVIGSLEDTGSQHRALSELKRVLKDGGLACCSVSMDNVGRKFFRFLNYLGYCKKILQGKKNHYFYSWCFGVQEFSDLLAKYGFRVIEVQPVLTRAALYQFFPFLRNRKIPYSLALARDGDKGFALSRVGEKAFQYICRWLPWQYCEAITFVAEKGQSSTAHDS